MTESPTSGSGAAPARRILHVAWSAISLATLLFAGPALAIDEADLLPVDDAFSLSVQADTSAGIAIRWKIADGYYLYKHRISAKTDAGFRARALQLPAGDAHTDEFFGRVETYRDALAATLPGRADAARTTLTVKYQGCADAGICYPPQTRTLKVALPVTTADLSPPRDQPFVRLGAAPTVATALGAGTDPLPLPPEQAFGFEAIVGDHNTLLLRFSPALGYYLYRDKSTFALDARARAGGIALGAPQWPRGTTHKDDYFGATTVFFDQIDVPLPLQRSRVGATDVVLTVGFQGCQTDGICYPPMTRSVRLTLPAGAASTSEPVPTPTRRALSPGVQSSGQARTNGSQQLSSTGLKGTGPELESSASRGGLGGDGLGGDGLGAAASDAAANPAATPSAQAVRASAIPSDTVTVATNGAVGQPDQADDSRLAAALLGPDRWLALLSFFGFGLLLAFTPCVLPMIPILSGLIAGHGPGLGARRAFALSLVYVLANALVFTAAGVVAGLLGANLQAALQTPWVIAAFAALFVALALSSFGLFELQLPNVLRSRLGALTDRQRGGSWAGVAVMGALSALIVGPCVAPPLAAAVLYIGQSHDPVFGGAALFLLAMGMGAPLLAFGVAAGRGLPTSGPWMVAVQRAFGFVFLGLAVWMASRVLPAPITLALWGALLLGAAAMLALVSVRTPPGKSMPRDGVRALGWAVAALLGLVGAAQVVGALAGSRDPLRPLAGLRGGAAQTRELPFRTIKSLADLDRELAAAQGAGMPLLLDFYADWCVACKEMERDTFPDPAVHAALDGFVLLKVDVTANDAVDQALMRRLGIIGPPATLFYRDGVERRASRLFGYEPAAAFVVRIRRAGAAR